MMGVSFNELLILAMLAGGPPYNDAVSFVPTAHYFQSRKIDPTVTKLIELASVEPKNPKAQIQQLLALRHLADKSDLLKKSAQSAEQRKVIERIAKGELANDATGFARDYAQRVLAKVAGKSLAFTSGKSVRDDSIQWFPANVKFAAALNLNMEMPEHNQATYANLLKLLSDQERLRYYTFLEQIGNARVDRIAFGMTEIRKSDNRQFLFRISGKINQAWLAAGLKDLPGSQLKATTIKDANGIALTTLSEDRPGEPVLLVVGDNDLVVAFSNKQEKNQNEINKAILEVRATGQPSAATVLKDSLAKIPTDANVLAFVIGEIPHFLREEVKPSPFEAPKKVVAAVQRSPKEITAFVELTMPSKRDAEKLEQFTDQIRRMTIDSLRKARDKKEPGPIDESLAVLSGVHTRIQDEKLTILLNVPTDAVMRIAVAWIQRLSIDLAPPEKE